MHRRIIRPVSGSATKSSGGAVGVELNLEDVRALSRQMVAEARARVEQLQDDESALEERLKERAATDAAEATRRRAELDAEIEKQRAAALAGLEKEREERLEAGRLEGVETGRREGFEAGYSEGREAGYREGREAELERLRVESERITTMLRSMVEELATRKHELLQRVRAEVIHFALELARRVIDREVREFHDEIAVANVDRALDLIFLRNKIAIHVNQDDLAAVEHHTRGALEELGAIEELTVRPATDVGPGGCRVLSGTGAVDLTIETQLEVIEKTLLGECAGDLLAQTGSPEGILAGDSPARAAPAGEIADGESSVGSAVETEEVVGP